MEVNNLRTEPILSYKNMNIEGLFGQVQRMLRKKRGPSPKSFRVTCPPYRRYRSNPFYWYSREGTRGEFIKKPRKLYNNPSILFRRNFLFCNNGKVITVTLDKSSYGRY